MVLYKDVNSFFEKSKKIVLSKFILFLNDFSLAIRILGKKMYLRWKEERNHVDMKPLFFVMK
ncbi:hypothetical protein JCM13369A_18910 [Mediterraneibacter glycyrrhizinilyticus JCM 13369]